MTGMRITSFERDRLTFDVVDSGSEDGEPIVLLHGFPQRASAWSEVTAPLNEAGFRTFAPDQRGYSPGARPKPLSAYRVGELVSDISVLIERIGQPVHLVGHDWGAAVGWATAIRHPDALRSYTAISVGHPAAFARALRTPSQMRKSYYMVLFQAPALPERILSTSGGWGEKMLRGAGLTDETYATFQREMVDDGALTGGLNWYRANAAVAFGAGAGPVSVPTTVIWSDDDAALGRRQAEDSKDHVTGAYEFVELPGASHWLLQEKPAEVADAIIARARAEAADPA